MDKSKLKAYIKSLVSNVFLATMMANIALCEIPLVLMGEGSFWWIVVDVIFCIGDTIFACHDWKKIKTMLEDNTNA